MPVVVNVLSYSTLLKIRMISPSQVGSVPPHLPSEPHLLEDVPLSTYPTLHVYLAVDPSLVRPKIPVVTLLLSMFPGCPQLISDQV